jgi:hypothetical protein
MDLAHVGVIVPNVEVGRDRLSELLGVEWGPEARVPAGDGESREWVTLRVVFQRGRRASSCSRRSPGQCGYARSTRIFITSASSLMNWLGNRLNWARPGVPLEYAIVSGEGPPILAYHRDALGVRIELVSSAVRSNIEQHRSPGEPT